MRVRYHVWHGALPQTFMAPLPSRVAGTLAGPPQQLATASRTFVMQTMGLPGLAEGHPILLNEDRVGIVEARGGLRMLVVFFALPTGVVPLIRCHRIRRTVIFLSAVPIALLSNLIRVTATGVRYDFGPSEMASHFFRDIAGWLMTPLAPCLVLGISANPRRPDREVQP